jgi:hypothetical protein
MNLLAAFAPSQARESLAVVGRMLSSPQDNSQSKTVHDLAAARVRDARCSPVKEVQISLDDLQ